MIRSTATLIFIFLAISNSFFSQDLNWAISVGDENSDGGRAVVVDSVGNSYVTGSFNGTADFDPSSATFNLSTTGLSDVFIAKYDPDGNFLWAKKMGGLYWDFATAIALDTAGNIFITGAYRNTCDFDPGIGVANITSNGWYSIFIAKYDNDGNYQWVHGIGGLANDIGMGIKTDIHGSVYATGQFRSAVDFDPSDEEHILTSQGNNETYLVKFDSNGIFQWAHSFGNTLYDSGNGLIIDSEDNVFLTGNYQGWVDFDPSEDTASLSSNGNQDIFIAKYSSSGEYLWAKSIGWWDGETGNSVALDHEGNLLVTGRFGDSGGAIDFDPGPDSSMLLCQGYNDVFIAKYDTDGNHIWSKSIGAEEDDTGYSIDCDDQGNVFIGGNFKDTVDFDPGPGNYSLISAGDFDIFIMQLNSYGEFIWARAIGSIGWDRCTGIDIVGDGKLMLTGFYEYTVDFDPDTSVFELTEEGNSDLFLAQYSVPCKTSFEEAFICSGNTYVFPDSSIGESSMVFSMLFQNEDQCDSLLVINLIVDDEYYISESITICEGEGYYFPDSTYSESDLTHSSIYTSAFGCDSIIEIQLVVTPLYSLEEEVIICQGESYILPNGNSVDSSGFYSSNLLSVSGCDSSIISHVIVEPTYSISENINICPSESYTFPDGTESSIAIVHTSVLQSSSSCDSIIISDLSITEVDLSLIQESITLSANQSDASYQWLDCNNDYQAIEGATDQTFIAVENGSYAVEIQYQTCTLISDCYLITSVGINEESLLEFSVYPNPFINSFTINTECISTLTIYSMNGQLIKSLEININTSVVLDMNGHPAGLYLLELILKDGSSNYLKIQKVD